MKHVSTILISIGIVGLCSGLVVLFLTFWPLLSQELRYILFKPDPHAKVSLTHAKGNVITPVDSDFGIVIPKIGANSRIIPNVDPFNQAEYEIALSRGVAMAKGSAIPGNIGNTFLFSHSSENFYEAFRYNSIFYLLSKLNQGDTIYLFYHHAQYIYTVTGKKIIAPAAISYLTQPSSNKTLTLMTCTPPGTDLYRLLVFAKMK